MREVSTKGPLTLNNNMLELIEQCVVKTKAFFVVIFQKTNKQKRKFVFLRKRASTITI